MLVIYHCVTSCSKIVQLQTRNIYFLTLRVSKSCGHGLIACGSKSLLRFIHPVKQEGSFIEVLCWKGTCASKFIHV